MSISIISRDQQAKGLFNGGEIVENKPIGFPQDGDYLKPYSNIFYWAHAWTPGASSTIALHPHEGFEIMSFVLDGSIEHFDTKTNDWITLQKGDVQLIQAGNGISHAEKINANSAIFQIWFDPNLSQSLLKPAAYVDFSSDTFPSSILVDGKIIHYAGTNGIIKLDSTAIEIMEYRFNSIEEKIHLPEKKILSAYLIDGSLEVNNHNIVTDDFLLVEGVEELQFSGNAPGRLFIILSADQVAYPTYAQQHILRY